MPASASASANSPKPLGLPDLPLVPEPRLRTLGVPLHLRRGRRLKVPGREVQHLARHIERILLERPEPPRGHQLEREPGPHVLPAMPAHQRQVIVIKKNTCFRSACDGAAAYGPYAAASSSVRDSTGIDRKVRPIAVGSSTAIKSLPDSHCSAVVARPRPAPSCCGPCYPSARRASQGARAGSTTMVRVPASLTAPPRAAGIGI